MAMQDVAVELFYGGSWHDLVNPDHDVYADPPIRIDHGGGEEGAAPKANRISLSLANDDDKYRPSNPTSPLYGLVGRNTPCRVSVAGTVRGIGEASFEPDQTDDFRVSPPRGKAWVDIDAAGLTQRIGQWTEPVQSAFRTYNDGVAGLSGYWPMEDARGTTVARSAIDGAYNTFMLNQSFGSQNSPPGGGTGIDVVADSSRAQFQYLAGNPKSTGGWQFSMAEYLSDLNAKPYQDVIQIKLANQNSVYVTVGLSAQTIELWEADAATGSKVATTLVSYDPSALIGRWVLWVIRCSQSGSTVTLEADWRPVDGNWLSISDTFTGVTSDLQYSFASFLPQSSTYGHVLGTRGVAEDLTSDARWDAFMGHPGELAAVRFGRLCDLKGVPYYVSPNWAKSAPMGPQAVDTFSNHLKEIAATDDALIFDHGTELRLYMLCYADRLNQTPTLTLDGSVSNQLGSAPKEVLNDLDPHNIVTASQRDGGDYTAEDSTSPMGSQPPPAGVGEYRQTIDVNVDDEAAELPQIASWWLAKGTVNLPRFPTITVDLVANPGLIPAVEATDTGSVIEIVNYREYTIRLHVLGWTEALGTHTRTVTFTCALDDVYNAGSLNGGRRLAARSTTLNAAITSAATSLTLKMTDPDERWRPGNNAVPVFIGGELITLGTVGAVTGTGPWTQTVTGCTRSVNGIVKSHSAGDQVTVKDPIRLTLGS